MILNPKQKNYLVNAIRKLTMWNSEGNEAKKLSMVGKDQYKCANCSGIFKNKEVHRDHINPIVPVTGFPMLSDGHHDWNTYIQRAIVYRDKYQILCINCHDIKTKIEDDIRDANNRAKKKTTRKKKLTKKK